MAMLPEDSDELPARAEWVANRTLTQRLFVDYAVQQIAWVVVIMVILYFAAGGT